MPEIKPPELPEHEKIHQAYCEKPLHRSLFAEWWPPTEETGMLTKTEMTELKETQEFREAFATALDIHQKIHEPGATHFRDCIECNSGFALLFTSALRQLQNLSSSAKDQR